MGQRYLADVLPWFVLVTAIAVRALMRAPPRWRSGASGTLLAVCFAFSVLVHHRGANSHDAWRWNGQARGIEAAAKDWRHPQFLAGMTFRVNADGSVDDLPTHAGTRGRTP